MMCSWKVVRVFVLLLISLLLSSHVSADVCPLPPESGACHDVSLRWFYNATADRCATFLYNGCGGNGNNFEDEESCLLNCSRTNDDPCLKTFERGTCIGTYFRWHFDTATEKCELGIYSGCGGNSNNFVSQEACYEMCARSSLLPRGSDGGAWKVGACEQPKVRGPCNNYWKRWYYNAETKNCEKFIYGGCEGSRNNFVTKSMCESTCASREGSDMCQLPMQRGPCLGYFARWYFNKLTLQCETFIYGGCGGNKNNFMTKEECEKRCTPLMTTFQALAYPCNEPVATGPCPGFIIRWGFVSATADCQIFIYGGCGGNGNNFKTKQDCFQTCSPTTSSSDQTDACKQPMVRGVCNQFVPRWFYNTASSKCEMFIYSGCGGNGNNFPTEVECQRQCTGMATLVPQENSCSEPMAKGTCSDSVLRWFFNSAAAQCQAFIYSGCGGNGNNFESKQQCEQICIASATTPSGGDPCLEPMVQGPCNETIARWYYNIGTLQCEMFVYSGCGGNNNNFDTREKCEVKCGVVTTMPPLANPCEQPVERGSCSSSVPRWYFENETAQCEKFIYSGCGGNSNNFETKEKCEQECGVTEITPTESDPCLEPMVQGPCNDTIARWHYNNGTGQCETFVYSGCGGNNNNFDTKETCEEKCGVTTTILPLANSCEQPMEQGSCSSSIPRWYFDNVTTQCLEFVYSGCGGNSNNFETKEQCEQECGVTEITPTESDPCLEPMVQGPCNETIARWHYNNGTGQCETFVYSGCGGNSNNFDTKETCEEKCGVTSIISPLANPCDQPVEQGSCSSSVPRWYFDNAATQCQEFIYSGCGGNSNNFETKEQCEQICCVAASASAESDPCLEPMVQGPCSETIARWHYNKSTGQCETFIYSGCGGSRNRFETKEACENVCMGATIHTDAVTMFSGVFTTFIPAVQSNPCAELMEPGPCSGAVLRWYFSNETSQCEPFIYGGCGGNANNFDSRAACEQQCIVSTAIPSTNVDMCAELPEKGPCVNFVDRWFYNATSKECMTFIYGGCSGNKNNFESKSDCEHTCGGVTAQLTTQLSSVDPCQQSMDAGPCAKAVLRWYYDSGTSQCQPFIYGGCQGNGNNFDSKKSCEDQCAVAITPTTFRSRCQQPSNKGPCMLAEIRWFFDNDTLTCQQFIYGGCKGNENNFLTKRECSDTCAVAVSSIQAEGDICRQPLKQGPCASFIIRWYFNPLTSQCEKFVYSGCGGNQNNFQSKEACENKCSITSVSHNEMDPCGEPMKHGPCRKSIVRWFYNSYTSMCEKFIYGGCEGNGNNFGTKEECLLKCVVKSELPRRVETDPCTLPAKQGPCSMHIRRWYYDQNTKTCQEFIYGGCDGNANNFETKETCLKACSPTSTVNVCQLPLKQGPCTENLIRWHYNSQTHSCEKFVFGGCEGNANNFLTKEDCEKTCHVVEPVQFAPAPQTCGPALREWKFESKTCQRDCTWCAANQPLCYRSKLECLEQRSPKDVICVTEKEGFHILNPRQPCTKYFFSCLGGVYTNHTCQDPYRFDVRSYHCIPANYVPACQKR